MNKQNILYICVIDITQDGGIEAFALELQNSLKDKKVVIISLYRSRKSYNLNNDVHFINQHSYNPKHIRSLIMSIYRMRRLVGREVIIHTYNNIFCLDGFLSPRDLKKMIYTEHSSYKSVKPIVRLLRNTLLSCTKAMVYQTDRSGENYTNLPFVSAFKIAPTWVEGKHLPIITNRLSEKKLVVGFAGRLVEQKGIYDFLQFVKNCIEKSLPVEAHIFGSGPADIDVNALAAKAPRNIFYHGYVDTLPEHLSKLDILMIVSKSESFSIVGIEALSVGCGVAYLHDLDGPKEFCNHKNSIKINRSDFLSDIVPSFNKMVDLKNTEGFKSACRASISKYSQQYFITKWSEVIQYV